MNNLAGNTMPLSSQGGFTLLELIVTVAIFGVMATAGYGGLRNILDACNTIDERQTEFMRLVTSLNLLQQDVENVIARSVRDEFGDAVPAMRGGVAGVLLELTRYRVGTPLHSRNTDLRRVEYRLQSGRLHRLSWNELDRYPGSVPQQRLMLADIDTIAIRFFHKNWKTFWPPRPTEAFLNVLPQGVEISLRFYDGKMLQRTFLVKS